MVIDVFGGGLGGVGMRTGNEGAIGGGNAEVFRAGYRELLGRCRWALNPVPEIGHGHAEAIGEALTDDRVPAHGPLIRNVRVYVAGGARGIAAESAEGRVFAARPAAESLVIGGD